MVPFSIIFVGEFCVTIYNIADAAGFASESAFYRNFKAATGQTPAEWLARESR